MSFEEKYKMYKNISIVEKEELKTRLTNNVEESLNSIYENIEVTDNIKYLINELLEDKEHLDAFTLANIERHD